MHLLNRKPSVEGYYGTMAQLIERPMTTTLAEYPDEAKEYYGYDPQKALAKFKEAGYEQKDGKLVKNGQQLVLNVYIGGDGIGDHPGYAMLTQAANDLKNMGGELIIHDVQFSVLQAAMNSEKPICSYCLGYRYHLRPKIAIHDRRRTKPYQYQQQRT